jgi:hypothetical protein
VVNAREDHGGLADNDTDPKLVQNNLTDRGQYLFLLLAALLRSPDLGKRAARQVDEWASRRTRQGTQRRRGRTSYEVTFGRGSR